jgi:hypothetical protein
MSSGDADNEDASSVPDSPIQGGHEPTSSDDESDSRHRLPLGEANEDDWQSDAATYSDSDHAQAADDEEACVRRQPPRAWYGQRPFILGRTFASQMHERSDEHQHWEVQGIGGLGGGLEWRYRVPCRLIHQTGRYERDADSRKVRALPKYTYACSLRGHCGRVVEYSSSFKGQEGSWLYLVQSPEGTYFLTQKEVDDIVAYLQWDTQLYMSGASVQDSNEWAESDPNFFDFDDEAEQERLQRLRVCESQSTRVNHEGGFTIKSSGSSDVDRRANFGSGELPRIPTSSRELKFVSKSKHTGLADAEMNTGVPVSSSRKRVRRSSDALLDWLESGDSPIAHNPYLPLGNAGFASWHNEAVETRTPNKRPRTDQDTVGDCRIRIGSTSGTDKATVGDCISRSGSLKSAAKTPSKKRATKMRKTRKGRWDAAYKALLALPLRSGLSREKVYAAACELDADNKSNSRVMQRFLSKHSFVFDKLSGTLKLKTRAK